MKDDLIKRKITTRSGRHITVYNSRCIGYVRFVVNGINCEVYHPESKPLRHYPKE